MLRSPYIIRSHMLIPALMAIALLALSCQLIPSTPEALGKKISEQLTRADPKASGVFFASSQQLDEEHFVVIYTIARQDDVDDPWRQKREVHFLFRPAPDDPEAPGGWYLTRIGGEYLEYLGVSEGLQFDWTYQYFQTVNGPREGIIGLAGMKSVR